MLIYLKDAVTQRKKETEREREKGRERDLLSIDCQNDFNGKVCVRLCKEFGFSVLLA